MDGYENPVPDGQDDVYTGEHGRVWGGEARGKSRVISESCTITAAIVLYHTKPEPLARAIKSYAPTKTKKLFLIDNSEESSTQYADMENIEYIFCGKNLGYGAAHNIGIKKAFEIGATYHIILNPDVYFEPSVIDALVEYADSDLEVVYLLPKVIYPNGELQYLCKLLPTPFDLIIRRFLPNAGFLKKRNDRYILKATGYDKIMNPPCLSGCFMFLRTQALKENHLLFDERFFMYCEDFDLIRRMHRIGKTIFYPYVTIVHAHAKASYKNIKMLRMHIASAVKYFNKYGWIVDKERRNVNKKVLSEI